MSDTIHAAICDDEPTALAMAADALVGCFRNFGHTLELERFTSPVEFARELTDKRYDLVFLDIDMPEINGIDLGVQLKSVSASTAIVFVSNYEGRVFDTFRAQPFGFVRKSTFLKDVESVTRLYIEYSGRAGKELFLELKLNVGMLSVPVSSISYIECSGDLQFIHRTGGEEDITIRYRMKKLEDILPPDHFLRIHQGYIVNYTFIKRIENNTVELKDGARLPVSRARKKDLQLEYMRLVRKDTKVLS